MRVVIGRQPGVENVVVSLERAMVDVTLRPGNTMTLKELRDHIKSGGFAGREAEVTVEGTLVERDGALLLQVTGTEATLALAAHPDHAAGLTEARALATASRPVQLTGRVDAGTEILKVRTAK